MTGPARSPELVERLRAEMPPDEAVRQRRAPATSRRRARYLLPKTMRLAIRRVVERGGRFVGYRLTPFVMPNVEDAVEERMHRHADARDVHVLEARVELLHAELIALRERVVELEKRA